MKPESFLAGRRCKICTNKEKIVNMSKSHEDLIKEVYDAVGDEYTVLSRYINNNTPIKIKHNLCGREYEVRPGNFLSGKRCKNCVRNRIAKTQRKTHEDFVKEVYKLVGDEYTILSEYKTAKDLVEIRHNKCM